MVRPYKGESETMVVVETRTAIDHDCEFHVSVANAAPFKQLVPNIAIHEIMWHGAEATA